MEPESVETLAEEDDVLDCRPSVVLSGLEDELDDPFIWKQYQKCKLPEVRNFQATHGVEKAEKQVPNLA